MQQVGTGSVGYAGTFGVPVIELAGGTLSPDASPSTMTVDANFSLLAGSVDLFELTPAVSDRLVVNGTVGIAPGALDLVTASGGVSGAFASLVEPASLNGLPYQVTRIQFVSAFTGDASFTPQAARAELR